MKLKIENRIRAGYATVFFLLLLSYISFFVSASKLKEQTDVVRHTNLIINRLESIMSYIKDAETGVRGYVAIKDERFLEPYENSFSQLKPVFFDLQEKLNKSPEQQMRLAKIKSRINEKYRLLAEGVSMFNRNNKVVTDSVETIAYRGKVIMDSLRVQIKEMEDSESSLLQARTDNIYTIIETINVIIVTSMVIAAVLAFYSLMTYNKENRAKKISDARALAYHKELEARIEELNKANKELMELKSIEKFAATGRIARTIAHEIRNPLTNIGLASEQLRSDLEGNEDHAVFFDMIDRNAKRINHLITDLLNSTKFAQLQFEDVNINNILDETIEHAKDRLELKSIQLVRDYDAGIDKVSVDKDKIKIAFLNVIVNAIEAMETGIGVLTIKTEKRKGKCVISIIDNGTGIDKDALGKLFEPYFTGKPKGTGLGLTLTQNIILNHQGSIYVDSETGKGTVFHISLNFAGAGIKAGSTKEKL